LLFFNGFHRLVLGATALVLTFFIASDIFAILFWERVDARVVSVTETCSINDKPFVECSNIARIAFHDKKPLKRNFSYQVRWTDKNGKSHDRVVDDEVAVNAFWAGGIGELVTLRIDPSIPDLPQLTKSAAFHVLAIGAIFLIVWFCFWRTNQSSIWGLSSLFGFKEKNTKLGLAQISWRTAFGCLWIMAFGFFAIKNNEQTKQAYTPVTAQIEAVEQRCIVKWSELFIIRIRHHESQSMNCARAEQYRAQLNKTNAKIEPANRYLVSYTDSITGGRSEILWSRNFPGLMPTKGQSFELYVQAFHSNKVLTGTELDTHNHWWGYLFYGGALATLLFGAFALWRFNASKKPEFKQSEPYPHLSENVVSAEHLMIERLPEFDADIELKPIDEILDELISSQETSRGFGRDIEKFERAYASYVERGDNSHKELLKEAIERYGSSALHLAIKNTKMPTIAQWPNLVDQIENANAFFSSRSKQPTGSLQLELVNRNHDQELRLIRTFISMDIDAPVSKLASNNHINEPYLTGLDALMYLQRSKSPVIDNFQAQATNAINKSLAGLLILQHYMDLIEQQASRESLPLGFEIIIGVQHTSWPYETNTIDYGPKLRRRLRVSGRSETQQ